jgi:hypothetical protein
VQSGIAQAAKDGKARSLGSTPALTGARGGERSPWLEPYGGDTQWRRQMWGAIVALHGRYPEQLQARKLTDYSQLLRQQGGGTTKQWKPGATPPEWAGR